MKIIVMDCANARIDVLNVPENMVGEDVELFLVEHDYSLNNISWMAVPVDYVPVQFHEFGIDEENGKEVHEQRETKLKNFSIYDSVQEVKHREQEELVSAIRQAILECHQIQIKYYNQSTDKISINTLNPYGFLYGEHNHYLVAHHADGYYGNEVHNFILSNIKEVKILESIIVNIPDFSLQKYAEESFGAYHEEPFDVEWLFDKEVAKDAEQYIFHPTQAMIKNPDGTNTWKDTLNFDTTNPKLMTYHSAKGLQFQTVFLLAVTQPTEPVQQKALYVAITRTYRDLYVLYSNELPAILARQELNGLYDTEESAQVENIKLNNNITWDDDLPF